MDKGEVPEEEYVVPLGEAAIRKEGKDVTVVGYSMTAKMALQVANKLDGKVSVEVIDIRTLEPLDLDTILESVEKTTRLVVVDEDIERGSFASQLSAQIMEQGFDLLTPPSNVSVLVTCLCLEVPSNPMCCRKLPRFLPPSNM